MPTTVHTKQAEYLTERVNAAATKHFEEHRAGFKSLEHFQECVACCYYIIAHQFGEMWNEKIRKETASLAIGLTTTLALVRSNLTGCPISRARFSDALGRFRSVDGVQHRPPYKACLDALDAEQIIHICNSYSTAAGNSFTKQYSLHNEFLLGLLTHYQGINTTGTFDIYSAICCRCPKTLLKAKLNSARKLYSTLAEINGIRLVLPRGWDEADEIGRMTFNPNLTLDTLLMNMKLFKGQKDFGDRGGRHYDWFTKCSKVFRGCLCVNGKPFREIVDLPSGLFLTLAIDGYLKGQIPYSEASSLIKHCFNKTFYSDIAREPKSDYIKTVFMRVVNNDARAFKLHYKGEEKFRKIASGISMTYPHFWDYIQMIRISCDEIGKYLYSTYTFVERDLINKLMEALMMQGHSNLYRVHDAIWGVEAIPEATHYLRIFANNFLLQL